MPDRLQPAQPSNIAYLPAPADGRGSAPCRTCSTFMFADMVGYSKLINRAGDRAIAELDRFRALFAQAIAEQSGTLIEYAGDSVFACFETPLAAVKAAINVQNALASANEEREPGQLRIMARIGLHTGEAAVRGKSYFGDDVNIAARLEPLAVAGGITLSKPTYDAVRTEIFLPMKWLGPQTLKNIPTQVRVYLLVPTGIDTRTHLHYFVRRQQQRFHRYRYYWLSAALAICAVLIYLLMQELAPKYSVRYLAIAPFTHVQQAGAQQAGQADYLGRGIAEAVRTQLGDMRGVYVVTDDNLVEAPLRLEGSVSQIADRLQIGYRLIRSRDGAQVAGNQLHGESRDILLLQDRLTREIAQAVSREFELATDQPGAPFVTNDATAYDYYLRGEDALRQPFSQEHTDLAVEFFNKALLFDNQLTLAKVGICRSFIRRFQHTGAINWLDRAEQHCSEAVQGDPTSAEAYAARGVIREFTGQLAAAVEDLHTALTFEPNNVKAMITLAKVYRRQNQMQAAEDVYRAVVAANPQRWDVLQTYGVHQIKTGDYQGAVDTYLRLVQLTPKNMSAYNGLGAAYLYQGQFGQAADAFERATQLQPDATALANAGSMHYFMGKYKKAEQLFREAQRLEPDNYVWSANRGDALRQLEQSDAAAAQYQLTLRLAEQTLRRNRANAKALRHAALASQALRRPEPAQNYIQQALASEPHNLDTLAMHARLACMQGNTGEALKVSSRLLQQKYSKALLTADPDLANGCVIDMPGM